MGGEEALVGMLLGLLLRLLVLPLQLGWWLLTRWGLWQGLRGAGLLAVGGVTLHDLAAGGGSVVGLVAYLGGDRTALLTLLGLLCVTGALFLFAPTPAAPATHGSAGWARRADLQGLVTGRRQPLPPGALALAPHGPFRQLALPPERATHHTLILGGSGTGKTRSLFMPNAARAQGSFVAVDPKGELWAHTSGYHADAWRFAPREPEASMCFNWVPWCRDPRLASLLAAAAMQTEADAHEQQFWKLADLRCCAALFAHAATTAVPTPATAYALLERGPQGLVDELARSPSRTARMAATHLGGLKAETLAGIVLAVANKLEYLEDERLARFTSAETAPADFRPLLAQPVAAYWALHEADVGRLAGLSALFFTLLLDQLTQTAGTVPVTLLLDEFANVGRLPHFPTTIAVARGRGLALVLGVQALAQLDALYGREGADTIRANCATKVVLHGLDYPSAEQVSRLLGEGTVQQEYTSRRPMGLLVESQSFSEHRSGRRLLTADEVRRLRADELLVVSGNRKPIKAGRWFWREAPRPATVGALGEVQVQSPALSSAGSQTVTAARSGLRARLRALDGEDGDAERLSE